jgi:hypothetical protein
LGEELVGSYLYQVHLHHELEFHDYDRSCQATMYIYKVKRMVYLLDRSDFEGEIFAQHTSLVSRVSRPAPAELSVFYLPYQRPT